MLSLVLRPAIICIVFIITLENNINCSKTQFLFENEKGLTSSLQHNYRLVNPSQRQQINGPQYSQNNQFGNYGAKEVIQIIDPPTFMKNQDGLQSSSQYFAGNNIATTNDGYHIQNQIIRNYPVNQYRPSAALLTQADSSNGNALLQPHQEPPKRIIQAQQIPNHRKKQAPPKLGKFDYGLDSPVLPEYRTLNSAMMPLQPLFPYQVSAAVRHKNIVRTHPVSLIPYVKQRVHTKKFKTYQSKMLHSTSDFEEEDDRARLSVLQSNIQKKIRTRRDTNSRKKSSKLMRGSLLPVALTIMGENGELLTGRALLQHITVLLKNASAFESKDEDDELNQFSNGDVLLNEKDFDRIMKNSMNLTDPVMLTVLGINALNDSSLLTNSYVNEYLNCMDASKITNRFQALQTKIDCMKRKLFDNSNFDSSGSSRYSISNLPAALVYADVMSNIKNLVRPKNGIAFYSLPVDELTHLQQVVLPIEDFVSQIHNAHFAPRNYHNRKLFFNENIHSRMPIFYIVKPDGRIYQTEGSRKHHPATIYHGFPDIPNADVYVDGASRGPFLESMFYDE